MSRAVTQTAAAGALPTLRAATEPGVSPGTYYGPDGRNGRQGDPVLVESNAASHDSDDARRLWEVSEDLTRVHWSLPPPLIRSAHRREEPRRGARSGCFRSRRR